MRARLFLLLIIGCLLLVGCTRTVTQIVTYGEQMVVSVTLRGTLDNDANRYFMVVSSRESFKVPLPPPDLIEAAPEFIEPDMTPEIGSAEAYFTNFFSTWSSYIILDPAGYNLVQGPFVEGQSITREVFSTLEEINNTLSFTIRLGRLFETIPDTIYFDVVAVPWPDGEQKIPADHLPSTDNSVSKVVGSITTVVDGEDSGINAALDIVNCRVEIQ